MTMIGAGPIRSRNARIDVSPSMPGQPDVEHHGIERARGGSPQAFLRRRSDFHVMPQVGEGLAKRPADARLVIDDQDAAHAAPLGDPVRLGQGQAEAGFSLRSTP